MNHFDYLKPFVNSAFHRFEQIGESGHDRLDERDRTIIAIWSLIGEVGNGGFSQFFYNSSGDWAIETVEALERIGANHVARIVRSVIADFPGGSPSPDRVVRHRQIAALPEDDELDEKWFLLGLQICEVEDDLLESLTLYLNLE